MTPIRHPRSRRAVALCLLASLAGGVASPALAARTRGTTSIYAQWLGERLGPRADGRTESVMEWLASSGFPTLRTYVVAFVQDLVLDLGLDEAARMLDDELHSSAADLTRSFLEGLRSLSAERLPEATLLPESDGRAVPLDRSKVIAPTWMYVQEASTVQLSARRAAANEVAPARRPACGGAQPLGP